MTNKYGTVETSTPMAIFSNEKSAKEYTEYKNERDRDRTNIKWFYYKSELYTKYYWKPFEPTAEEVDESARKMMPEF